MKLTDNQKNFLRLHSEIIVEALPEDTPIKGNAIASGDEKIDKECEDEIYRQLDQGNEWAWCCVKVTLRWKNYEGVDYLGCCSYKSKSDFMRPDDYFSDMVNMAFQDLVNQVECDLDDIESLLKVS